eukprot:SAG31_NODE_459_length_15396_cov_5.092502_4_plen_171_part_00
MSVSVPNPLAIDRGHKAYQNDSHGYSELPNHGCKDCKYIFTSVVGQYWTDQFLLHQTLHCNNFHHNSNKEPTAPPPLAAATTKFTTPTTAAYLYTTVAASARQTDPHCARSANSEATLIACTSESSYSNKNNERMLLVASHIHPKLHNACCILPTRAIATSWYSTTPLFS